MLLQFDFQLLAKKFRMGKYKKIVRTLAIDIDDTLVFRFKVDTQEQIDAIR